MRLKSQDTGKRRKKFPKYQYFFFQNVVWKKTTKWKTNKKSFSIKFQRVKDRKQQQRVWKTLNWNTLKYWESSSNWAFTRSEGVSSCKNVLHFGSAGLWKSATSLAQMLCVICASRNDCMYLITGSFLYSSFRAVNHTSLNLPPNEVSCWRKMSTLKSNRLYYTQTPTVRQKDVPIFASFLTTKGSRNKPKKIIDANTLLQKHQDTQIDYAHSHKLDR